MIKESYNEYLCKGFELSTLRGKHLTLTSPKFFLIFKAFFLGDCLEESN